MEDACRIGSATIRNISYGIIVDLDRMFAYTYIEILEITLIEKPTLLDVTAGIVKATRHY